MLKIRLQRVGRVHQPSFRLVLTDSKNSTKSGRFKEILGSYDPRKSTDNLNADRIKYWISQGAGLTDTTHNLLVTHKIISAPKIHVSIGSEKAPVIAETPAETPAAESPITPASEPQVEEKPEEKTENAIIEDVVTEKAE